MEDSRLRADRQIDLRIGEILRKQRLSRRVTLMSLGQRLGITYQQVRKYEIGENRIPASTLYRMAVILRCDPGDFFEGVDGSPSKIAVRMNRQDVGSARALGRIGDPVVKDAFRELIDLLGDGSKAD